MSKFYTIKSINDELTILWKKIINYPANQSWINEWYKNTITYKIRNNINDLNGYQGFREIFHQRGDDFDPGFLLQVLNWIPNVQDWKNNPFDGKYPIDSTCKVWLDEGFELLRLWAEINDSTRYLLNGLSDGYYLLANSINESNKFDFKTYSSFLKCMENVVDILKITYFNEDDKKNNLKLINHIFEKDSIDEATAIQLTSILIKTIEFNPFFLWNIQNNWIKHPKYRRNLNKIFKNFRLEEHEHNIFLLIEILKRNFLDEFDNKNIEFIIEKLLPYLRNKKSKVNSIIINKTIGFFGPTFEGWCKNTDVFKNITLKIIGNFLAYMGYTIIRNATDMFIVYKNYDVVINKKWELFSYRFALFNCFDYLKENKNSEIYGWINDFSTKR